jgi:L-asparaginase II
LVISKAGAVGLQSFSVLVDGKWLGVAVKIIDGAYGSIITRLTYHVLSELGIESSGENKYNTPLVKTRSGEKVGSIRSFGSLVKY